MPKALQWHSQGNIFWGDEELLDFGAYSPKKVLKLKEDNIPNKFNYISVVFWKQHRAQGKLPLLPSPPLSPIWVAQQMVTFLYLKRNHFYSWTKEVGSHILPIMCSPAIANSFCQFHQNTISCRSIINHHKSMLIKRIQEIK